ncbi:MAG: hypothetical protein K5622_04355 [Endomicrobiaceae bacterium]|nr:hypothetical protein [Endomicrobiaceae bacterium]
MNNFFNKTKNGYLFAVQKGIESDFFNQILSAGKDLSQKEKIKYLRDEINSADAILVGAGSGLSASAGFTYTGERFTKYFFDFAEKYGITNIYSGGFYNFKDKETFWAWWARHIYYNRYIKPPKPVYNDLLELIKDKNYFVITTNVDHLFQKTGFDKSRLFYTQGDYGLFQSINPEIKKTYDNEKIIMDMMEAQGFVKDENGEYQVPQDKNISMRIPTELIPKCPDDNSDVIINIRFDSSFVEDEGWKKASANYYDFLIKNQNSHILYLELGVGIFTPIVIKMPFWQLTYENEKARYTYINSTEAFCPEAIKDRSVYIKSDIGEVLKDLLKSE